jgi:hypothetical protein
MIIPKTILFKEMKPIETVFDCGTFTADNILNI